MTYTTTLSHPERPSSFDPKPLIARAFSVFFLTISLSLAVMAAHDFVLAFFNEESVASAIVKSINVAVVSLAILS